MELAEEELLKSAKNVSEDKIISFVDIAIKKSY